MASRSPSRLQKPKHAGSQYWEHFGFEVDDNGERVNPSVVICKVCRKDVAYSSNTTNLRQHLESSHRELLPSTSAHEGSVKQVTLKETLSSTKKLASNSARAVVLTKSLAEFIAKDMRPIATIEGAGFCHFMSIVEPRYVCGIKQEAHLESLEVSIRRGEGKGGRRAGCRDSCCIDS